MHTTKLRMVDTAKDPIGLKYSISSTVRADMFHQDGHHITAQKYPGIDGSWSLGFQLTKSAGKTELGCFINCNFNGPPLTITYRIKKKVGLRIYPYSSSGGEFSPWMVDIVSRENKNTRIFHLGDWHRIGLVEVGVEFAVTQAPVRSKWKEATLTTDITALNSADVLKDVTLRCSDEGEECGETVSRTRKKARRSSSSSSSSSSSGRQVSVNEPIQAHKLILAARSFVFKAMFSNNMLENEASAVTINDISTEVMQAFVQYCYTDTVDESVLDKHCLDLFGAAFKYDVNGLKTRCDDYVQKHMCVDSCLDILQFADLHEEKALKKNVLAYIAAHASVIVTRYRGKLLELSPSLNLDIMQAITQASASK